LQDDHGARRSPRPSAQIASVLRIAEGLRVVPLLLVLLSAFGSRAIGADDSYRFAAGKSEERGVTLASSGGTLVLTWPKPASDAWDTALLAVRVEAAAGADVWVEITAGKARVEQHLDPNARGVRWLNLSGLKAELREGRRIALQPHGMKLTPEGARLRVFANRLDLRKPLLVLAPHPDDAEIAAFGLWADRNATILTLTAGNAGDANYQDYFDSVTEQFRWKGYLRAVDSVTVPWQGGVPPERCFNLGYFDARLPQMHKTPDAVVPEVYGPNSDTAVYRRANVGRLLDAGSRASTWRNLVADVEAVLRKVKPELIVTPHPFLDYHGDHQYTTVALVEALQRVKPNATFLLYTNHAGGALYPYGPAGTAVSLPPWSAPEVPIEGLYSHPLDRELQRRKLFAIESHHDLRPSPSEQAACPPPGTTLPRPDYPRQPAVDYFRRAPRSEELFFVYTADGLRELVRSFRAQGQK
jgi:LmbE family N-acetylglucosaminyl deacetylase